jgi:pyridoxal phosphate enzyme (YggS family)
MPTNIQQNILTIKNKIEEYEKHYHRPSHSVSLLAVSKNHSAESIKQALLAGQTCFGENYLQEALEKMAALQNENLEWHFIGSIQSNKTKKIAEHFAWVHSVSDIKILKRLNDQRPTHLPPLNICLEINVSAEKTKSGAPKEAALSLAKFCSEQPRLLLRGLMTIPAEKNSLVEQRAELQKLRVIFDLLQQEGYKLDTLSMGMSHDMEAAIAEGATVVRIGRAIFGDRIQISIP